MRNPRRDLFLVSFLILFFELAAIRWFGATVVFLTFFSNIVLLACFLGMSLGLLCAGRPRNLARSSLPLAFIALGAAVVTNLAYFNWAHDITFTVGNAASPRLIYFGTEYRPPDPSRWVIPVWAVGALFFTLITLVFVGLGQVMGRAFSAIPDRVSAYTLDILGSLSGIVAFAAMSYLQLSPMVWFVPILGLMLYFAGWRRPVQLAAAAAAYGFVAISAHDPLVTGEVSWSPYYKVTYTPALQVINTNDIGHQNMTQVQIASPAYLLPYLLVRDAGGRPFPEVMVIGAGNGNDVAAALFAGAQHVDAVEIDPRIAQLGREHHRDKPYANPAVTLHLDDGRSFVRNTERKYDLAIYALVDSLVLHSGYSSVRLENFLFTRDALEDVKRALKPDGVFLMYNYYRQGWLVERLAAMAREVFGADALVISLPNLAAVEAERFYPGFTLLMVSADPQRLAGVRSHFAKGESFWIHPNPTNNVKLDTGFRTTSPGPDWYQLGQTRVEARGLLPSDDWPQPYLRTPEIPWAPIGQGMLAVALISAALLFALAPRGGGGRFNWQMFFLGAGFMLLETKGVVHMALLFGSTWAVNSVVFAAILVMILFANMFVLKFQPRNLIPYYILLIAALLVNALVPMSVFLSLSPVWRTIASCAVVFVPVFFAGVIFASRFRDSRQPGVDFGSNVAGIILGGLSENLSLVLGFSHLLLVATAYYLLSAVLRPR